MNMSTEVMKSNPELRYMARQQLKGKWLNPILVCVIYSLVLILANCVPYLNFLIYFILSGPMVFGVSIFFLKFCRGQKPSLDCVFDGFKCLVPTIILMFLIDIFVLLWSLLLIIPGIIAALSYSQCFYILYDNPGIQPMDAFRRSKEMMLGHRCQLFRLYLSFIGWYFLSVLTCGAGFIWLAPYIMTSATLFYENLKKCKESAFNPEAQAGPCHCGCHEEAMPIETAESQNNNIDTKADESAVAVNAASEDTLEDSNRNMAADDGSADTDTNTADTSDNDQSVKD